MQRQYYLSKFIGDGKTTATAFKPKVAQYGDRWGKVDLRPDQTKQAGWCVAYLDSDDHSGLDGNPETICLGADPHAPLPESLRQRLNDALEVKCGGVSISDILMELCLSSPDFRPNLDGKYEIHLGGLLKELTEEEAMAFIGRIVTAKDPPHVPSDRTQKLSDQLRTALESVAALANYKRAGWLEKQRCALVLQQSKHPLAINYQQACNDLAAGEEAIWSSHAAHWVMMLARDVDLLADKLNLPQVAGRLRSPKDCEPTKFELYVMAAYQRVGARLEKTDNNRTGEFRVKHGDSYIYVECKQKSLDSVKERRVREIYKRGTEYLQDLMLRRSLFATIHITLSSDPIEADLEEILKVVDQEFPRDSSQVKHLKKGKSQILIIPSRIPPPSGADHQMLKTPRGYDHAVSQGRVQENANGGKILVDVWGVAWRSLRPTGWVTSAIESVKNAAKQLPSDEPSLIYLEVPRGDHEVVAGRIAFLARRIQPFLESRKRINALILTGVSLVRDPHASHIAITSLNPKIKNSGFC